MDSFTMGLQEGGLDPVAIPAEAGDTLAFTVDTGGAQALEFIKEVPDAKRPTVVRTDPKSGKRDVPLNIQVRIIFSEPVNPETVTNSTLVIGQQRSQIDGDISVSPDGLLATFLPRAQLLPETDYTISVGSGILDIDGTPLDGPVTASFTTAPGGTSPGAGSDVLAFNGDDLDVYLINTDGTILRGVARDGPAHRDDGPVWSPTGDKLAFWRSGEIHVANADGSNPVQVSPPGIHDRYLAWSPDGRKIAFDALDTLDVTWHIYVVDADGTNLVRLTPPGANETSPGWSADGQRIYFQQSPSPYQPVAQQIYAMNADGTNRVPIGTLPDGAYIGPWSPDGSKLAFGYNDDIYGMDMANGNTFALADSPTIDHYPAWSPDGSRIAYSEEGVIYVRNADGANQILLDSPSDVDGYNSEPAWSPDGSAVVFTRRYLCSGGHRCGAELRMVSLSGPFTSSLVTAGSSPSWRP
jgi:TolB protein